MPHTPQGRGMEICTDQYQLRIKKNEADKKTKKVTEKVKRKYKGERIEVKLKKLKLSW
jgi:hypothetical protein